MLSSDPNDATPENLAIPSLPDSPKIEECEIASTKSELLIPAISEEEESKSDRSDTLPENDKPPTPTSENHSSPVPKIIRPLSQKFIDEALSINIMNLVGDQPSNSNEESSSLSDNHKNKNNNVDNKIYKLDCSTNKVLMTTNYKFDKNSKLFIFRKFFVDGFVFIIMTIVVIGGGDVVKQNMSS